MNPRIEVEQCAGDGAAGTAAVREPGQTSDATETRTRSATEMADQDVGDRNDRLSVDPLRSTDRYRLVAPLSLRF